MARKILIERTQNDICIVPCFYRQVRYLSANMKGLCHAQGDVDRNFVSGMEINGKRMTPVGRARIVRRYINQTILLRSFRGLRGSGQSRRWLGNNRVTVWSQITDAILTQVSRETPATRSRDSVLPKVWRKGYDLNSRHGIAVDVSDLSSDHSCRRHVEKQILDFLPCLQ